jgi:hypothetical protein
MPTEHESIDVKKAMAYDLLSLFDENEEKTYTTEEVRRIIKAYIAGLSQK